MYIILIILQIILAIILIFVILFQHGNKGGGTIAFGKFHSESMFHVKSVNKFFFNFTMILAICFMICNFILSRIFFC